MSPFQNLLRKFKELVASNAFDSSPRSPDSSAVEIYLKPVPGLERELIVLGNTWI
jgi:hypothetical protein